MLPQTFFGERTSFNVAHESFLTRDAHWVLSGYPDMFRPVFPCMHHLVRIPTADRYLVQGAAAPAGRGSCLEQVTWR